jgi:hypothetical protein
MRPSELVERLIHAGKTLCARDLIEASVHLPRRGSRWVAAFRDERGRPTWRTTGLRKRTAALALAKRWEAEAKRKREAQPVGPRRPKVRVRPGSGEEALGLLTQKEVAMILRISERTVRELERRAFEKLRRHPALKAFWNEWTTGEIEEAASFGQSEWNLSRAEIAAVYALARSPAERQALTKLFKLMASNTV